MSWWSHIYSSGRGAGEKTKPSAASPQVDKAEEASTTCDAIEKCDKHMHDYTAGQGPQTRATLPGKDSDIKTLGEALKYFGLYQRFQQIESSLEDVRRHRTSREQHESELKRFDKEILQLSQKHHPDRVRNRGGSDEEIEEAKNLQASLNAIRTVLYGLSKAFLDNIHVDHMYGFYTDLSISSVGNEDEIGDHVYDVFFKINFVSEIKNQNIIPEIRKFIAAGKDCLKSLMGGNVPDFTRHRDVALSHLRSCIVGYTKLQAELGAVEKEFKSNSTDKVQDLIRKMSSECARGLQILNEVKHLAKQSLNGTCRIFPTVEPIDKYFVLPFVEFINSIIMCNTMVANENQHVFKTCWRKINLEPEILEIPFSSEGGDVFTFPYYLASYFSGDERYGDKLKEKMEVESLDREAIKKEFLEGLENIIEKLENTYREENYIEGSCTNQIAEDFMECLKLMTEFDEKEKKLRAGLERLETRHQDLEERLKRLC